MIDSALPRPSGTPILSRTERRRVWRGVSEGRVPVLVGARSALFLPFDNLGLIIVDEEHDSSFKQEDGVAYNARDMAIVRGQFEQCPVVLVSATPSLETVVNVTTNKFDHLTLPNRHGGAQLPDLSIIDMRAEGLPADQWISAELEKEVHQTIAAGEQALLFLNRRGYAPLTLCRACGHRFQCPNCQAWLVEHRHSSRLRCHHCDYATGVPAAWSVLRGHRQVRGLWPRGGAACRGSCRPHARCARRGIGQRYPHQPRACRCVVHRNREPRN